MQVDLFETMVSMYRHYGMNVLLLRAQDRDFTQIDFGFRQKISPGFDYENWMRTVLDKMEAGSGYLYEDDLGLEYYFFYFPAEQETEYGCRFLVLGPALFHAMAHDDFVTLMEERKIPPVLHQDFLEFFNHLPIIAPRDSWYHLTGFFLTRLCGFSPELRYIQTDQTEWFSFLPAAPGAAAVDPEIALRAVEDRYRLENALMEAVSQGNISKAHQFYYQFRQHRIEPRVPDPIRDQKNLLFTFNTLLRKAAETGHVHPLHIDSLSRQLAIQIELSLTSDQLEKLNAVMIRKYCMLVQNYSTRPYSQLVRSCLDHIDFYYASELSLSSLARLCSVSESHLSTSFKKETGMTVTDCINSTRIRHALILLNTSSLSIGEIASRCGFFDANYFSRIFKKMQGMTPRQYRTAIRQI